MLLLDALKKPAATALAALVLTLSGCGGGDGPKGQANHAIPNVSLVGSPNDTRLGTLDPNRLQTTVARDGNAVVAAFRARECGAKAPDFEKLMRRQTDDGLRVPNGITLYDAGVGTYTSRRCGAPAQARAIGVHADQRGTYSLPFFKGKTTRTVTVQ